MKSIIVDEILTMTAITATANYAGSQSLQSSACVEYGADLEL